MYRFIYMRFDITITGDLLMSYYEKAGRIAFYLQV